VRVLVVFFGGQYNHLIVRRLAELGVETGPISANTPPEEIDADALVMGGDPQSVPADLPKMGFALEFVRSGIPLLGICLSHHVIARAMGGKVGAARVPEFGEAEVEVLKDSPLFEGVPRRFVAWESHNDEVLEPPPRALVTASSEFCGVQALEFEERALFGVQFHPEVSHTQFGVRILENFLRAAKR